MKKRYIGDSVYVEINDFGQIVLTVENDELAPSNTIYLELEVYQNLVVYIEEARRRL